MLDVVARACQDLTANAFVNDILSLRRPLRIRSFPSTQLYHGQEQKDETLRYFLKPRLQMLLYILLQSFASLLPRLNEAEVEVESTCQQLNAGPLGQSSLRGEGHRSKR